MPSDYSVGLGALFDFIAKLYHNLLENPIAMKKEKSPLGYQETVHAQGSQKLKNYFDELIKLERFNAQVVGIRKKYQIPEEGLPLGKELGEASSLRLMADVTHLCKTFRLYPMPWLQILTQYVIHDDQSFAGLPWYDLCLITDAIKPDETRDELWPHVTRIYPIAILINPNASKRDILDFVTKHYKAIKVLQDKNADPKSRIGKVKRKNPSKQAMNQFIYDHRDLPLKRIRRLLADELGPVLDDGHIGKIRSHEKKIRQEL